jgi:hypothetical protein
MIGQAKNFNSIAVVQSRLCVNSHLLFSAEVCDEKITVTREQEQTGLNLWWENAMKTMIILLALIAIPGPSIAGAQGRGVAGRSGFVARPGFSHRAFFPRPFVVVRPGFPHRAIYPGVFVSFPYAYSYPYRYSYPLYPYAYGGYTTPYMSYSARSYSISPPPPPSDAYDRGYAEGYAQGYEQAQKEHDKDRYEEGKQRGYQEGYEAGQSGENP